jgi:hypothetical protein
MSIKIVIKYLALGLLFGCSLQLQAQKAYIITGHVNDASTKEPLAFASVLAPKNSLGTQTDENGRFSIRSATPILELRVAYVGYKSITIINNSDSTRLIKDFLLEPQTEILKEVLIKPKKYRNKNNPAVELIRLVVDNRKNNRIENFGTFQEEQYEKIMMGLSNLSEKTKNRRLLRSWKFAMENVDTSKLQGSGIVPAYLQESIQDFYSQNDPKRRKTLVKAAQKVRFPLLDEDGIEKYLRYMYQDVDIYDNYIVLLTDHFLSPISDNAPLFYRYYPADTTVENGSKIVRLQFFPRNKTDMLLQGDLYIALDSTYPVTRIVFSLNPNVNLNWVRSLEVDQSFQKTGLNGKWVLSEESLSLDFGLSKRGMGFFGERFISHQSPMINAAVSDSVFRIGYGNRVVVAGAEQKSAAFWEDARHVELSAIEAATYKNIDSLQRTRLFVNIARAAFTLTTGYWKPTPGLEIGPIHTFYSFNDVEGNRVRFGGRTNPKFSKRINLEGFAAYGFGDKRWKYGLGANISLSKRAYNLFPYNLLRINYQEDLMIPGVIPVGTFARMNITTSFTRGPNDRFNFQKRLNLQYEKEFSNKFSFMLGLERRVLEPVGSLRFLSTEDAQVEISDITTVKPFIQMRFAPGEEYYQSNNGWRQRIRFNFISQVRYARGITDVLGGQYKFDEIIASAYKFSNTPPFGYNYFYIEAGGLFGKVPYPLLSVHRANQSYSYRFMAYNMMNFMEFVSDRYIAANLEHAFYGFFTNKIPLLRRLKLRELATFKILYGQVSRQNQPEPGSGLFSFPLNPDGTPLTYTLESKPYMEAGIGIGNILKIFRVDFIRRLTYLDHPGIAKFGVRVAGQLQF